MTNGMHTMGMHRKSTGRRLRSGWRGYGRSLVSRRGRGWKTNIRRPALSCDWVGMQRRWRSRWNERSLARRGDTRNQQAESSEITRNRETEIEVDAEILRASMSDVLRMTSDGLQHAGRWRASEKRQQAAALQTAHGTMMRDSSRLSSGDCGNWARRNSMKRRERGRPLVRSKPMR